jgi:hypothetical protein
VAAAVDVADELREIAKRYEDAGQLLDLEGALRDLGAHPLVEDRARRWATVNLHEVFLGEESPVGARRSRLMHVFDVAVEVLVFVPVVVTWLGLALAFGAYESASQAHTLDGESFLQGWDDGFHGRLPSWLTFGHLAWITVITITVLIIAVAIRAVYAKLVEDPLRRRLAATLTGASLELAGLRLGIPEQVSAGLDLAADKLATTVAAIEAAGRIAARTQQKAMAAVSAIDPALAGMTTATKAMTTAAGTLATVPDAVGGHLDQMSGKFGDAIDQASGKVSTAADQAAAKISGTLGAASGRLDAALDSMGSKFSDAVDTMNGQVGGYLSQAGQAAVELAAVQRDAVDAQLEAVKAQRDLVKSGTDSSKRVADALTDGAAHVHNALNDVTGSAIGYAHRIEVAADVIGRAVTDLPPGASQVAAAVSQVETVVSQLAMAISGLKQDLAVIGGQLAGLQSGVTTATGGRRSGEPPTQSEVAARELRSSATELSDAARAMRQSLDQFRAGNGFNGLNPSSGRRRWGIFRRP